MKNALEKFKDLIAQHEQKLYRFMYKEGILDDEEELTEEDKYIVFQYKIMAIIHKCLEESLKDECKRNDR